MVYYSNLIIMFAIDVACQRVWSECVPGDSVAIFYGK